MRHAGWLVISIFNALLFLALVVLVARKAEFERVLCLPLSLLNAWFYFVAWRQELRKDKA